MTHPFYRYKYEAPAAEPVAEPLRYVHIQHHMGPTVVATLSDGSTHTVNLPSPRKLKARERARSLKFDPADYLESESAAPTLYLPTEAELEARKWREFEGDGVSEVALRGIERRTLGSWDSTGWNGDEKGCTYRTKWTVAELAAVRRLASEGKGYYGVEVKT